MNYRLPLPYDLWAPLGTNAAALSYEQCVEWICEALAPLGVGQQDLGRRVAGPQEDE